MIKNKMGSMSRWLLATTSIVAVNLASAQTQTYAGNETVEGPFSSGTQFFLDSSVLNASAADSIIGGYQVFNASSVLNALAADSIRGGTQNFYNSSVLNASVTDGVRGGSQYFFDGSVFNAGVANAVRGGAQFFNGASTLNALATEAIGGGTQSFYSTSTLNATAANTIIRGDQYFYNSSVLEASTAGAISGGSQSFFNTSILNVRANNALTATTNIQFVNGGRLQLNGYSATIGSISSVFTGSGAIINGGAVDSILSIDMSAFIPKAFSGTISDGEGGGTLALILNGGSLTLAGTASHSGGTTISGGKLMVGGADGIGSLAGSVVVNNGGTLGGSGTIGSGAGSLVNVGSGGTLSAGNSPGTLRIDGSLILDNSSISVFELNKPGVVGGAGASGNDLVSVSGDLTLGGTLDARVSSAGYYRLFTYGGTRAGDFSDVTLTGTGSFAPVSSDIIKRAGQIDLAVVGAGQTLQFWDGPDSLGNGAVDGGAGVWASNGPNWTGQPGQAEINGEWLGSVGVFAGIAGGAVTVAGAQSFDTLQFSADGYVLSGDALAFAPANGSAATIQVEALRSAEISSSLIDGATGNQLVKTGAGTLTLTGENSYTGGTIVQGGQLIGNLASIKGDVQNAGTVVLDQNTDETYAASLSGYAGSTGTIIKNGTGGLTLTGTSSLNWTIGEGRLSTAAERFSGDALLDEGTALVFGQELDAQYAGILSGSGTFEKNGPGALVLSGASGDFNGNTNLSSGALVVNGSLGGVLAVRSGSRLGGSGRVGSATVDAGGIIAPGTSIGTLTIDGDLTLNAGSLYEVEVDPAGNSTDLIHVTGSATLGGTVTHIGNNGEYRPSASYTILTADGGVNGTFGDVTSNYAFLSPDLSYGANSVTLTLRRNDISFCAVSSTANQCAVGNGVESLGVDASLYGELVVMDAAAARGALDQLSGEIHASSRSTLIEVSRFIREAASLRLRRTTGGLTGQTGTGQDSVNSSISETGLSIWGHGFGSWGHLDGFYGEGTAPLQRSTAGLIAGVDAGLGESWRIGVLGGYSNTSLDDRNRNDSAKNDTIHLGLYSGGQMGPVGVRMGASYGWHNLDTKRIIGFAGFAPETLNGDYKARTAQLFGEIGYRIAVRDGAFEPFANLAWVHMSAGGFVEDGGAAALNARRSTSDTGFSTLGLRATGHVGNGLELYGSIGWRYAFGDVKPRLTQAFTGGDAFTVTGNPLARNAAVFEAGIDRSVGEGLSVGIAYSGQISDRLQDHGIKGQVRWAF